MQEARLALARHPRCAAHARTTKQPCRNPAMANGRCRMHGGSSLRGQAHPNYRHGAYSIARRQQVALWRASWEAMQQRLEAAADPIRIRIRIRKRRKK